MGHTSETPLSVILKKFNYTFDPQDVLIDCKKNPVIIKQKVFVAGFSLSFDVFFLLPIITLV